MSPQSFTPYYSKSLSRWPCPQATTTKRHGSRREAVLRHYTCKLRENPSCPSIAHQYQRLLGVHSASWHWGSYLVLARPRLPCLGPLNGGHDGTRRSRKRVSLTRRRSWTTAPAKTRRLDNDNVLKYLSDLDIRARVPSTNFRLYLDELCIGPRSRQLYLANRSLSSSHAQGLCCSTDDSLCRSGGPRLTLSMAVCEYGSEPA